ncbi:antitoxin Xre/MbcA/ParS toxin-binding domain-containing protein [Limimaricola variabilis]|uniref:antitoxin Xre/MbcA/ParS toxin-binding domain-containing protein n=1 Tax=Limimaricola variabilis TaxID=1492771 RepID=UPI002AC91A3D|nr:antitoxin Xre/MbcA/ParS toxin-binding domain-containing protein [Limimaricola variabilis]WPY93963.1 antitoxin Xre/MbcA/ParS toxin-binding domain-containing protein [Limimaricola variabilis]
MFAAIGTAISPERPVSPAETGPLVRTAVLLARVWELGDAQMVAILGGMQPESWRRWCAGCVEIVDRERLRRMALLRDIHLATRTASAGLGAADWIRARQPALAGRSPLQMMASGQIDDLVRLRDAYAPLAA